MLNYKWIKIKKYFMLTFRIEKDENKFHTWCPELLGCHTFGDTPEIAIKNLKNAIELYIEDEVESQTFDNLISTKKDYVQV